MTVGNKNLQVCVVGGGINGLTAALYLVKAGITVTLMEATDFIGGQIKTTQLEYEGVEYCIEEGAEGYVARSTLFPEIAEMVAIKDCITKQEIISDFELRSDYSLVKLEPGEAAKKLGFQVPKEDTGKGVCSFTRGMSQLVNSIISFLKAQSNFTLLLSHRVTQVQDDGSCITLTTEHGVTLHPDYVIFSIFPEVAFPLISPLIKLPFRKFNSHVSMHVLVKAGDLEISNPRSFTVASDFQDELKGLRAVSFVNEKFPTRVPPDFWLFRFYFRRAKKEEEICAEILGKLFHVHEILQITASVWDEALPESPGNFENLEISSRICVSLPECAGLQGAAAAGKAAATRILKI